MRGLIRYKSYDESDMLLAKSYGDRELPTAWNTFGLISSESPLNVLLLEMWAV